MYGPSTLDMSVTTDPSNQDSLKVSDLLSLKRENLLSNKLLQLNNNRQLWMTAGGADPDAHGGGPSGYGTQLGTSSPGRGRPASRTQTAI